MSESNKTFHRELWKHIPLLRIQIKQKADQLFTISLPRDKNPHNASKTQTMELNKKLSVPHWIY